MFTLRRANNIKNYFTSYFSNFTLVKVINGNAVPSSSIPAIKAGSNTNETVGGIRTVL